MNKAVKGPRGIIKRRSMSKPTLGDAHSTKNVVNKIAIDPTTCLNEYKSEWK